MKKQLLVKKYSKGLIGQPFHTQDVVG